MWRGGSSFRRLIATDFGVFHAGADAGMPPWFP
jgi:hypothetical protein